MTIGGLLVACCPIWAIASCAEPPGTPDSSRQASASGSAEVSAEARRAEPVRVAERREPQAPVRSWPAEPETGVGLAPTARLRPLRPSDVEVKPDRYQSARICGSCHEDILFKWAHSMHALAYTDRVFRQALLEAYYYSEGKAAERCLRCHSPTAVETGDFLGKQDLTLEGVTCDYCHSIDGIEEGPHGTLRARIDHSKLHGPLDIPEPPQHSVAKRDYFSRSEICAVCHDYTTEDGTVVFATYAEWRASKYAEIGKQCQDCHMPRLERAQPTKTGGRVFNDHDLQGGHSKAQIKKAIDARIEEVSRDGDRVRVVVAVENVGAGHSVPTGLPSRMLVLTVTARQRGRKIFSRETVYKRVLLGDDHRVLTEDWEIKLLSKSVLRDNRIRAGETRREIFVFDASPQDDIVFEVEVAYRYRPRAAVQGTSEVSITRFEKILERGI